MRLVSLKKQKRQRNSLLNRKQQKGFTEPMRTCIGCRESKPKKEMIRIACYEGRISVDVTGRAKGRGVYICKDPECLEKVRKTGAVKRGFKMNFAPEDLERVYGELEQVMEDAF